MAPSPAKERLVFEGFSSSPGEFRYPSPAIKAENLTVKEWKPTSDTILKSDHVIRMYLRTEPNEVIRFLPNCMVLRFRARYANPAKSEAPGANNELKAATWLLRAKEQKPPVFLDPGLGAASFFSKIEVKIKETKMDAARLEEFGYLYQSINRRFCADEHCYKKYSAHFPRITNTSDRVFATAALMAEAPPMLEAASSLTFDSFDDTSSMTLAFNMDGHFPFDVQSNLTAAVMDMVVPSPYLRPSTEIYVDLHRRHPIDALIDSSRIKDDVYFDGAAVEAGNGKPDIAVEFEDLSIMYESLTPDPALLPGLMRGNKGYYVDVPKINHKEIAGGVRFIQDDMTIPEGTKLIVVGWVPETQLVYDPASKVNLHSRFRFPEHCTEMKVKLTGKDGFVLHDGFANLGNSKGVLEPSSRLYHFILSQLGLWDQPYSKMFPRSFKEEKSYDQLLILNTSKFVLKDNVTLTVTGLFDANGSPKKHRMVVLTLQQYLFTQSENGSWKFEVQI